MRCNLKSTRWVRIALAALVVAAALYGLIMAVVLLSWWAMGSGLLEQYRRFGIISFMAAVVLARVTYVFLRYRYLEVCHGKVVKHLSRSSDDRHRLYLLVEGLSRAGELRRHKRRVTPELWLCPEGTYVTF